jgi:murein DD-endopeptidase MepM/ murein hydrolase activator NlpD
LNNSRLRCVSLFLLLFCFSACVFANSVPGGIAMIGIQSASRPSAWYQGNRVLIIGKANNWKAVVGIDLNANAGIHFLEIESRGVKTLRSFDVSDKQYKTQHITIQDKRKVNPDPLDMERINKDIASIALVKGSWLDVHRESIDLILPVTGPYTSPFGLRRFFNKQARKPHSGLDIAAGEGTSISAAGSGKVINIGDYFFNGKTVFLDHGQGLITMYCHMNSIDVSIDQEVQQGETIGSVGQTGRVTGAHLHWGVILNKTMVNPELLISQPN